MSKGSWSRRGGSDTGQRTCASLSPVDGVAVCAVYEREMCRQETAGVIALTQLSLYYSA